MSDARQAEVRPSPLFICLGANKFVLLTFFSLIKRIYPRVSTKLLASDAKSPLPVDVRRQKHRCLSSLIYSDLYETVHQSVHLILLCVLNELEPEGSIM